MNKWIIILIMFCLIDSVAAEEENTRKIPLKAATLSIFIPGGGQFYNEKYVKSGFVLALESGLIGLALYDNNQAEKFYAKYQTSMQENDYDQYVNYYEKRQSDFFWIGMVVFLSMIDAYVDAHLYDFEEKKNKIHLKFEDQTLSLVYNF
ncbi:MAG: hypothetical protein K9N07_09200 [Candidatus Cloacimonetes bacterium]|nr:hypothetical protein [Candidatus Cloacimonadota bacterium]